jgi:hypothetical protein
MLETNVSKERMKKLNPVLVDENKKEITDTMYGTGKATYDRCNFMYYADFKKYRTKKVSLHGWYAHDTVYYFAAGKYIVKYNFCKYQDKKLYLRYLDPYTRGLTYHYIEIVPENRIHLHDYSVQINKRETDNIKNSIKAFIMTVNCDKWGLRENDCSH